MTTQITEKKRVLSWDVGIKNLAYCIVSKNNNNFTIEKWGIINLSNESIRCDYLTTQGKQCCNNASIIISHTNQTPIFPDNSISKHSCRTHRDKMIPKVVEITNQTKCLECNNNAKFGIPKTNLGWCQDHSNKSVQFGNKIKHKKVSTISSYKISLLELSKKLFEALDAEPAFMKVDEILIENQPTMINPTMKTIASFLHTYFCIRGLVDINNTSSTIKDIKFISPSNKLKIDESTTEKILNKKDNKKPNDKPNDKSNDESNDKLNDKSNDKLNDKSNDESNDKSNENTTSQPTKNTKIYKMTKKLGVRYCQSLISEKDLEILNSHKKKDDLSDSFLQAFQYLFAPVPKEYLEKIKLVGFDIDNKTKSNPKKASINTKKNTKKNKKNDVELVESSISTITSKSSN